MRYFVLILAIIHVTTVQGAVQLQPQKADLEMARAVFFGRELMVVDQNSTEAGYRRMLTAAGAADGLPAWRGRIDPMYKRAFMAPALAQNKCDNAQQCTTNLGTYPYEEYIIDPTGDSNEPVLKISYPQVSVLGGVARPAARVIC